MTQMIESLTVEPALPEAGEAFSVIVEKSSWDFDGNKAIVIPAAGVRVQVGIATAITDEQGIAKFTKGVSNAGEYSLVVSGYGQGVAPTVVRHTQDITIAPAQIATDVTVRVEGTKGQLAQGTAQGETTFDALAIVLEDNKVSYHVEQYSFGKYVDEIDGLKAGSFGGYDGWMTAVKRDGKWIEPMVSIDAFELEQGDEVVYYYSNLTALIHSLSVESSPKDEAFVVQVNLAEGPAVGIQVEVADMTAITNDSGAAVFENKIPNGKHTITASGYRSNDAPTILVETLDYYQYDGMSATSSWALKDVQKALAYGIMKGTSADRLALDPKKSMTRAEYVSLLLRLLDEQPAVATSKPYSDVSTDAWFAGDVLRAKQIGFIDATSTTFRPTAALTRQEMAVMTAKALQLDMTYMPKFNDLNQIIEAAQPYVSAVHNNGIILGGSGFNFNPNETVKHETAASVAVRIFERYN
jgi:hypothetical protein